MSVAYLRGVQPTPGQVLAAALRAVDDPWPATEQQRLTWFDSMGLTPTRSVGDWEHWGTGIDGWGDTQICWSCHHDAERSELSGIGWFLWGGPDTRDLGAALHAALVERLGPSCERSGTGTPWRQWRVRDRFVELGCAADDPRLQLHVVAAEFADDPAPEPSLGSDAAPSSI